MANLTRHESRQAAFQILFALEKDPQNNNIDRLYDIVLEGKDFDDYLKNKSLELYNETNKSYIKIFRNSKFIINLLTPYHLRMRMYKKYLNTKSKRG